MAITRIQNNQITDSSAGNVYLGVNAAAKVQDYSITAGKIANNLTYGSDFTITGNLTVQGNTTTIDTVNLTVEDPLILLAKEQTGSPTLDIGYIGKRGTEDNIAFVWDESANEFVTVFTTSENTNTVITISSYASLKSYDVAVTGNLTVTGTSDFNSPVTMGNITFDSGANIQIGNNRIQNVAEPSAGSDAATKDYVDSVSSSGFTIEDDDANTTVVSGGDTLELKGTADQVSVLITGNDQVTFALTSNVSVSGNVTGGNLLTGGTISSTGTATVGNLATGGTVSATGTATAGNVATGGTVSATGNVTGGNLLTSGLVSSTGNVTAGNVNTAGLVTATGNVTGGNLVTGGLITASGNIAGNNITAADTVSAGGNITGLNVVTALVGSSGGITIQSLSAGDIVLDSAGNIDADSNYVNNVLYPVQDTDAATKLYVDNMVTTAIAYHEAVYAATTANLATTTGGTITYDQPNGAGNGVGATITTTGSFNLIDTANVQTANTRILVKDEGNAVLNGIYVWSNATVITRSSDADTYAPATANALSINDYFFVQEGNVNKGSAWIVDEPSGNITFGTSNIAFAQFSSSQTYTANTQAGLVLNGTVFSAKVDNDTTAFDGGGNISVKASANLVTPNIGAATGTSLSVTANVIGGNVFTGGVVSATGNVSGNNFSATGNVAAVGFTGGNVSVTGNVTAANFIGNIPAGGANTEVQFNDGDLLNGSANFTFDKSTNIMSVTGTIEGTTVSATGNVIAGNVTTAGLASASGNITSGSNVVATANVIGGNISTAGLVTATGNVTGGNLVTAGIATVTGNVIGGNITTAGLITATGNITGANLILTSGTIDGPASGIINVNGAGADTDFAVSGDTLANILYIDAGTGTASFGSSTQTTGAGVAFNYTNSVLMPVGNTAQRPGTGVIGMLRFNTGGDALEVYTSDGWEDVGVPAFTVITADSFTGNGVQTTFTLSEAATTSSVIVSINGVVQIPTTAYAVTGNSLQFTEAPGPSDTIDARILTTTTTVASLENASGNAIVEALDSADTIQITGNLLPAANITYDLGSPTKMWNNGYFAGNTIYLGNLQLKQADASTFAVYTNDGVTQANIDVGSVDVSSIISGTTVIGIGAPNGNAYLAPAGSNALVAASTGVFVTGLMSATGNVIAGNLSGTNIVGTLTTAAQTNITSVGTLGSLSVTANVTGGNVLTGGIVSATGNIDTAGNINVPSYFVYSAAVQTTGLVSVGTTMSAAGNVTGANLITGGLITATGNITGGNVLTGGIVSATGNVTAGNLSGTNIVGTLTTAAQTNITSVGTLTSLSVTGNITGGNLSVGQGTVNVGNIVNTNANGVGNIGSSSLYFNTVFAKATSAQYADLAEMYEADGVIEPGTVVEFGGSREVTACGTDASKRVAGVVSTNPSYIMNAGLQGANVVAVALTGRVPVRVTGTVRKGDMMVAAGSGRARAEANPAVGSVIGKALADFDGAEGTIEVVVGRL